MSTQACYPHPPHPYEPYGSPGYAWPSYGTTAVIPMPVSEERIREIIREELRAALNYMKNGETK